MWILSRDKFLLGSLESVLSWGKLINNNRHPLPGKHDQALEGTSFWDEMAHVAAPKFCCVYYSRGYATWG